MSTDTAPGLAVFTATLYSGIPRLVSSTWYSDTSPKAPRPRLVIRVSCARSISRGTRRGSARVTDVTALHSTISLFWLARFDSLAAERSATSDNLPCSSGVTSNSWFGVASEANARARLSSSLSHGSCLARTDTTLVRSSASPGSTVALGSRSVSNVSVTPNSWSPMSLGSRIPSPSSTSSCTSAMSSGRCLAR